MRIILLTIIILLCCANTIYAAEAEKIPDVTVTPTTPEIENVDVPLLSSANTKTLTATDLKQKRSISQLLNGQAGLQTTDLYGNNSHVTIAMRGFGDNAGQNSIVLINGEEITWPDMSDLNLTAIDLSDTARIEIYPGSNSVLYGDQAVGGIININEPTLLPSATDAAVTFGSYNGKGATVAKSYHSVSGFDSRIGAKFWDSDQYRQHNHQTSGDLNGRVGFTRDDDKIFLRYVFNHDDLELPGALTAAEAAADPTQAQNSLNFSVRDNQQFSLVWQHQYNADWQGVIDVALANMNGHGVLTMAYSESRTLWAVNPKLNGIFNLGQKTGSIIIGAHLENSRYAFQNSSLVTKATQDEQAFYGQGSFNLLPDLTVIAGDREAFAEIGNELATPTNQQTNVNSIEVDWHKIAKTTLFLRRAGSYRFAKADENAFTQTGQALLPQTGTSLEMGIDWRPQTEMDWSFLIYQLDLQNEIIFVPDVTQQTFGANQNLPPTRRRGIIAAGKWSLTSTWSLGATYNWVDAHFIDGDLSGKEIPFVAQNIMRASSSWTPCENWLLDSDIVYTGSRFPGADLWNRADRLPAYALADAGVSYHFNDWRVDFEINNLLDKRYNGYATAIYTGNGATTYFYPAAGRTAWLTLSWTGT